LRRKLRLPGGRKLHIRLCRIRWDGGRGDRNDAAAARTAVLAGLRGSSALAAPRLFITTESWLNAKAQPAERGQIFSIYMVGTFLALALGQLLIGPIGRLSDRFDRRIVLAALGLAGAAVALVFLDIDEAQKVKSR
jgi:MFS family permease